MNTKPENTAQAIAPKAAPHKEKNDKPTPKAHKKDDKPKPKPKLHPLRSYAGTVGKYGANPEGVYDSFELVTAGGSAYHVAFPPHFGQALHQVAQPGQPIEVLGYLHLTPKGDEHLHLARVEAAGQQLRPAPPKDAEPADLRGEIAALLLDPKDHPRGLRLVGEAAELRLPPHLGQELASRLVVGATVAASGHRKPAQPGELRVPGTQAPLTVALLTVGDESFLIR